MSNAGSNSASSLALLGGAPVCPTPLSSPDWPPVSEATADRLQEVYLSRQWSFNSPAEQEFAQAFASYHDAKHGIFMMNGTVTIQCSLAACGVGPGDEVIVPALTWLATAMAAHYLGATPVFVDIDPETLCLDPLRAEAAITEKTRAIIPVHLYGSMADLEVLLNLAKRHGLFVIEDCAHMQGGKWDGRGVGSWGDVGSFSFQQSKTISSGEGGICITNDDDLADRIFRMKHIGYAAGQTQGNAQQGPPAGLMCHNFRTTAFEATILSGQLKELPARIERYNATVAGLEQRLANAPGLRCQTRGRLASPQGYYYWLMIFDREPLVDIPLKRILDAAAAEGLQLLETYGPVYRHVLYNMSPEAYRVAEGSCPVAEGIATERTAGIMHTWLGSDEKTVDSIGKIITKVAANANTLREP